jgi:hypothetical protein
VIENFVTNAFVITFDDVLFTDGVGEYGKNNERILKELNVAGERARA